MNRQEAFNALDQAKATIQSKYGCSKGASRVFFDYHHDRERGVFVFTKNLVTMEYRKNQVTYSSHDWKKERPFLTNRWVTINESKQVIFEGKGRYVLKFMQNYSE